MANDFFAFGSAIYARIGTAGTVPVYNTVAPQGILPPYAIFQRNAADDDYVFGAKQIVDAHYVVKIVSYAYWTEEAERLYGQYHDLLQSAPLSATGYSFLRCVRQATLAYQDEKRYWHVGGVYKIEAQAT